MDILKTLWIRDFREKLDKTVRKWENKHNLRPRIILASQKTLDRIANEVEKKGNLNGRIGWIRDRSGKKRICLFENTVIEVDKTIKYGEYLLK